MKKIFLFLTIPVLFSCNKVLETSPYSQFTDASAFSSAAKCALALNGVYDAAQGDYYVTGTTENRGYPFGAANISQGDCRGEDVVNVAAFYQITYQATYNSTSANCVAMWKGLYELINKANVGIAGFKAAGTAGIISTSAALQYEAECRFLRAMAHHEALIQFARPYLDGNGSLLGVPWRDFPINSSAAVTSILNTARPTVAEVYSKILADLDFAETNLPNTISSNTSYRATKAAAIALKMRIKLHKGDWAGVITEGAKLVPTTVTPSSPNSTICPIGSWALTASPDGPFANNNSSESIFSIKNDPLDAPSTNAGLSRMFGSASISPAAGRGLVVISPIIWNNPKWLCTDKRRTLLTIVGTNANGGTAGQSIFTTKYRDYATYGDYAPQIRYAEVILMLAEAEARNAGTVSSRAVDLLNLVRNRSLANPTTEQYTTAGFATKNDLIAAILLERRIEFLCEGKRWSDISRLAKDPDFSTGGIPAKVANGNPGFANYTCGTAYSSPGQAAIPYTDYRFIWPIPASEISQNPVITQNPNY